MQSRNREFIFHDFKFIVNENVYLPAEDSFLLAEKLDVKKDERVLDMGTGCGLLSILSAKTSKNVVAVDINPYAIRCAKKNAKLNNVVHNISFIQGDLFAPFKEKEYFDLILFNAPYLPEKEQSSISLIERSWAGGLNGRKVIDSFLLRVGDHLSKKGRFFLIQSTLSNINTTLLRLNEEQLTVKIIAEKKLPFFEKLVLIEAKLN